MLISSEDLQSHLTNPEWVIFDCRHDLFDLAKGEKLYREGHLPGAHFANVDTDLSGEKDGTNGRHPLPSAAAFTAFLARHGVSSGSKIVAYDDVGGQFAARLWWMARWVGLENVVLLDGGSAKWHSLGFPLATDVPVPTPVALRGKGGPLQAWSAAEVVAHIADPKFALIDARPAERYRGESEPIDPVAGHIPGALNRFYKANLNADLSFRPARAIREEFLALTCGRAAENIVHYCGSGVTACANIFAMEYAGLTGSKLFPGSWSEWVSDRARPVATAGK